MASNPTLTQVVVEMIGAAIKFPQQINATSFLPNAVSINNRSASTIQVGPASNGPFILMGQFTLAQLPWTYGRSIWVQEVGGPASHIATEFVQVTLLEVSPAGAVGAGNITSYAPSGWGSVGPTFPLVDVHAGDPFNYGQVQQLVQLFDLNWGSIGYPASAAMGWWAGWNASNALAEVSMVNLYNAATPTNAFQFWDFQAGVRTLLATITGLGRLVVPLTGASAKQLLNWIPHNNPTGATATGSGNQVITDISLSADIPASSVMVALTVHFTSSVATDHVEVFATHPASFAEILVFASNQWGNGVLGVTISQSTSYIVTATGNWSLAIYPTAYVEPS